MEITSSEARKKFSDIINRTAFGKERMVITRRGKDLAAIIPLEDLELLKRIEDELDAREAQRILEDPSSEFIDWKEAKETLDRLEELHAGD